MWHRSQIAARAGQSRRVGRIDKRRNRADAALAAALLNDAKALWQQVKALISMGYRTVSKRTVKSFQSCVRGESCMI